MEITKARAQELTGVDFTEDEEGKYIYLEDYHYVEVVDLDARSISHIPLLKKDSENLCDNDDTLISRNGDTLLASCACGMNCWCGSLILQKCDEEEERCGFYVELFIGPLWEWKTKLSRIWDIIMGRPFSMYMCLSKSTSDSIAEWIRKHQK